MYQKMLKHCRLPLLFIAILAFLYVVLAATGTIRWDLGMKESFRWIDEPKKAGPEDGPAAYMPAEQNLNELPVGGKAGKLGTTTTWFARGGKVGGMDNLRSASEMGYSRPERLDISTPSSPAPANVAMGYPRSAMKGTELSTIPDEPAEPGKEMLPKSDTGDLLESADTVSGPGQPLLTSLRDRTPDLSGRKEDPTNERAEIDFNNGSGPLPADESFSSMFY